MAFITGRRWDEMGRYDIPAELNYVLNKTERQKLIYIGHSMGKHHTHAHTRAQVNIVHFIC